MGHLILKEVLIVAIIPAFPRFIYDCELFVDETFSN